MLRLALVLSALSIAALTCGGLLTAGGGATNKLVYSGDWIISTKIVGKYYGSNVRNWLVNCSSSEGGHGGWVWRSHIAPAKGEDKPGGWMQFFASTFYSNVSWALADASKRGLNIHPRAKSYYEPLGQAVVAGAMYYYHGSGPWTGGSC